MLVGEGSFGGDGKQPQMTLRMHIRHETLLRWLVERFPRTRLYGPYHHGERSYFQWMARGPALVEDVLPVLDELVAPELDEHAAARLGEMRERYGRTSRACGRAETRERGRRLAELAERSGCRRAPARARALLELLARRPDGADDACAIRRGGRRPRGRLARRRSSSRRARRAAGSPTSAPAPAFPAWCSRRRCRRRAWRWSRAPRRKCAFLERADAAMGLDERRGRRTRVRRPGRTGIGAAISSRRARWRRSTCSSSTRRRCCAGRGARGVEGAPRRREEADGAAAAAATGLELAEVRPVQPCAGPSTCISLYMKVGTTPNRFPRRPGMARKRPLRASS